MRAVALRGAKKAAVKEVTDANIEEPTDILMRVTSQRFVWQRRSTCTDGRAGADPGLVLGHEPLGMVEEVGEAVKSVKRGDRVVVPTHLYCGYCFNCRRGRSASCLTVNPGSYGAAYGSGIGPYRGAQAELLRVPFADANWCKLPGEPHDELEDDFVLLADAWVTGWHATELAGVYPTATVAIFGAGAVGLWLPTLHSTGGPGSLRRGHDRTAVGEGRRDRRRSDQLLEGDPVEQIVEARRRNQRLMGSLAQGDEQMIGVMCGIDCVGFQARDREEPSREHPSQVVREDLCRLEPLPGRLGIAGVYVGRDPKAAEKLGKRGHLDVPWPPFSAKG